MTLLEEFKRNFYRKGTTEWDPRSIISAIVVVIALLFFVIFNEGRLTQKATDRVANRMYAIGVTGKKIHSFKSSKPTVDYTFRYGVQEIESYQHIDAQFEQSVVANGGRYYVEFSSKDPSNSKLLLAYPVPDSITDAPGQGWTYMPGY